MLDPIAGILLIYILWLGYRSLVHKGILSADLDTVGLIICGVTVLVMVVMKTTHGGQPYSWDSFYVTPDTPSYVDSVDLYSSHRSVIYPWFIDLTAGAEYTREQANTLEQYVPLGSEESPLIHTARLQKLINAGCLLLLMWCLSYHLPGLFVGMLGILIEAGAFVVPEISQIMTEGLAQAWQFAIASLFLLAFKEFRPRHVLLSGVVFALSYNTRPASIFTLLFFGALTWTYWRSYPERVFKLLGIIFLTIGLTFFTSIIRLMDSGMWMASEHMAIARIQFAVELAQEEDIERMPSETGKVFLTEVLKRKKEMNRRYWVHFYGEDAARYRFVYLFSGNYENAQPVAQEMGLSPEERVAVFTETADVILSHRPLEYCTLASDSLGYMIENYSRISRNNGTLFLLLTVSLICTAWILRSPMRLIALSFLGCHLFHLVIVAFYDMPHPRYVRATEYFYLLAAACVFHGMYLKFFHSSDRAVR